MNKINRDNSYLIGNQFAKGRKPNQTSFQKGSVPWNKGVSVHLSPATEFKKGRKPLNHLPVGTILQRTSRKSGTRNWIKIAEPSKWEECAKYIWKQTHGFLVKGDVTHHKNGVRLDDRIENIIAFPRQDHPIFHNRWWLKELTQDQLEYYIGRYEVRQLALRGKMRCPRCNGFILNNWGELSCINCGEEVANKPSDVGYFYQKIGVGS